MFRKPSISEFELVKSLAKKMALDGTNMDRTQFIIRVVSDEIVGFVRIKDHGIIKELATLGVPRKHRKLGMGKSLIHYTQTLAPSLYLVTVIPEYFMKLGFNRVLTVPSELKAKLENKKLWEGYGNPVVMNWTSARI